MKPTPSFAIGVGWSALASLFAAGFLIPYRMAVAEAPRLTAMTAMFAAAVVFNSALGLAQPGRRRLDRLAVAAAAGLAVLTLVGNFGIAMALPRVGAGMTSAVMKAQVILTPLLAAWLLSEPTPPRLWAGAALAFAGFVVPQVADAGGAGEISGYLFGLMSAIAFAGMQILTRRVIHDIHPPTVNALRLVFAVLLLLVLPDGRAALGYGAALWGPAALAGLLGPGVSRLCLMAAARHISPSLTALIALIGPVFAFGLGYLFFGEAPTPLELAGAGLILVGVSWPIARRGPLIPSQSSIG